MHAQTRTNKVFRTSIRKKKTPLGNFDFMLVKSFSPLPKEPFAFNLLSPVILTGEKRANYLKALLPPEL